MSLYDTAKDFGEMHSDQLYEWVTELAPEVTELPRGATVADVRRVTRHLLQMHPDKNAEPTPREEAVFRMAVYLRTADQARIDPIIDHFNEVRERRARRAARRQEQAAAAAQQAKDEEDSRRKRREKEKKDEEEKKRREEEDQRASTSAAADARAARREREDEERRAREKRESDADDERRRRKERMDEQMRKEEELRRHRMYYGGPTPRSFADSPASPDASPTRSGAHDDEELFADESDKREEEKAHDSFDDDEILSQKKATQKDKTDEKVRDSFDDSECEVLSDQKEDPAKSKTKDDNKSTQQEDKDKSEKKASPPAASGSSTTGGKKRSFIVTSDEEEKKMKDDDDDHHKQEESSAKRRRASRDEADSDAHRPSSDKKCPGCCKCCRERVQLMKTNALLTSRIAELEGDVLELKMSAKKAGKDVDPATSDEEMTSDTSLNDDDDEYDDKKKRQATPEKKTPHTSQKGSTRRPRSSESAGRRSQWSAKDDAELLRIARIIMNRYPHNRVNSAITAEAIVESEESYIGETRTAYAVQTRLSHLTRTTEEGKAFKARYSKKHK